MALKYTYRRTEKINKHLERLALFKEMFSLLPRLPRKELNLRRKSLLASSVYSARIEGNRLQVSNVGSFNSGQGDNIEKREIYNIFRALEWIYKDTGQDIDLKFLLKLHRLVMAGVAPDAGRLRGEQSAIFNQAGVAVFLPPPFAQIPSLLDEVFLFLKYSKEPVPVMAAISHFAFEKIHPFLDGNGRVGRLLSFFILNKKGYGFRGFVNLEEFLENNRDDYYAGLAITSLDITVFVEFFLEGMVVQVEKAFRNLGKLEEKGEDFLLPRRREILEIIRDHGQVSFDFIRRRFMAVSTSTLHYDLKKLTEGDYIKKLGTTRGVCYSPK